jgi:hypothetical protein
MAARNLRENEAMMEKPKTYNADLSRLPAALAPLTLEKRWVVWPWELRSSKNGQPKWTKPPRQAGDPKRDARSNDPATWGSYEDAVAAVAAGNADGIGYMLKGSTTGAIDLDHCVERDSAKLDLWAERLHEESGGAYHEITVSGGGLRIIGTVAGPEVHRRFTFDRNTGAGIEIYRNATRYITISGLQLGSCAALPPLDDFIDKLLARYSGQGDGLDFNNAGRQNDKVDYDAVIRNGAREGERSELFAATVWHLAGQGFSVEQITDELAKHPNGIGAKYADRLHAEVARCHAKWRARKRAAATGGEAAANAPWPQIFVHTGELPHVVNQAEDALLALGREIYQRGGLMVRPVLCPVKAADDRDSEAWRLIQVTRPHLVETLTRAAQFLRWDARAKKYVPTDAPEKIAETYLARQGSWKLPVLAGIVNTPFLRADGSLCDQPGYDAASGLLFKPDGETFPQIPANPGKSEAAEALKLLEQQQIESFPFVAAADRAVALSAMLTILDRRSMATAPLHAFTAPVAGSGKSLLVDMVAVLATGRLMPVIAQGRDEAELEKRLGAALLAGDVAISIDNCEHVLQSALLCQALTQQQLNIRILGLSRNVETPVNAALFCTGNNLVIAGDLTRRVVLCSLDAGCERPELRTFEIDPVKTMQRKRGILIAAALTVLRAWQLARPTEKLSLAPFGSFADWSRRVREALVWLDHADPCDTISKIRSNDPRQEALTAVLAQWCKNLGTQQSFTVQEIIGRAVNVANFHAALLNVAAGRSGHVSNERLGRWLKRVQGKIANNLAIIEAGNNGGYPLWKLVER